MANNPQLAAAPAASWTFSFRYLCLILFILSALSSISFLYWSHQRSSSSSSVSCYTSMGTESALPNPSQQRMNLLTYPFAWNHLTFPSKQGKKLLKIALFVKKWPHRSHAGGLERHALTLHLALAERGHEIHIFTAASSFPAGDGNHNLSKTLIFHLSKPTAAGYLDQAVVWKQFQEQNHSSGPFDVVHTESVGLMHTRSKSLTKLAVSWHGIAYETIHSDIIQELIRNSSSGEPQSSGLTERLKKVVDEVRFFPRYAHHVATSNHAGDILKRIYMIPEERVHIILNGVDEVVFRPQVADPSQRQDFLRRYGISRTESSSTVIFGTASRLVKDKGHPVMFEALRQLLLLQNNSTTDGGNNEMIRDKVMVLVAGDGPWGPRYKELGYRNVKVLGPLDQSELARFYNAIDIFVNPTLRAQGLDHTLLEAMLCGKPVMATKLASITGSVIVGGDMGYTFSPTVESLKEAMRKVWKDGKGVLEEKGRVARERGLKLFTAKKMADAYERLFLCIAEEEYCVYHYQP